MNRSHLCRSFAVFLLLSAPFSASALTLPGLPAGMCPLDENVEAERVVYDYLKAANESTGDVVAVFGDCNELKGLVAGKRNGLNHYGTVLRQTQIGKLSLTRQDYLASAAAIYATNNDVLLNALESAQGITGGATKEAGLSSATNISATSKGVLHKDNNVVIMGVEQSHVISGQQHSVASTVGLTLIDGDPVSVNLYAPANEHSVRARAVQSLTSYVATLVKANPGPSAQ